MVIVVSARSVQSCAGLSRNGWFGYLLALRIGQWPPEWARRMATCSAELVWQTVAFLHQIEAALVGRAWQSLQNTPETRQEGFIRRADYRCGYLSFNFEEKKMKNVLLATTAIALTAGYAAADVSYSASAKLSYGNFGEQNTAGTTYGYSDTFDFGVSGSGEAGGVAYSASMTIDEDAGSNALGAFSMSSNGLSYTYDAGDIGGLETANANGLDEAAGDWKIAYAANGFSAGYEVDEDVEGRSLTTLGYAANGLSIGLEVKDDDGNGAASETINTVSVGYTMGALSVSYDADDQATQNYDAKVTYTMGGTVLSAGTDEIESHYVGITTTVGGMALTARSETDGNTAADTAENELSISYTMGALTIAYAKDTGDVGKFGDEAETLTTLTYDLGGVTLVAKGNDQEETEVSAAFSF
ncbi:porin [Paracoccaceae bacterium]|nr:porin [Paracoccaceae bacterium]